MSVVVTEKEISYRASRFNAQRTMDDGSLIVGNTSSGSVVVFESSEEVAGAKALLRGKDGDHDLRSKMIEHGLLVPSDFDERRVLDEIREALNSEKRQHLIIMPTEDCNFRCHYCYESFAKGAMRPNVRESVKRFLDKKVPQINHLEMAWFGGEPLFAFRALYEVGEHARQLCERHGVSMSGNITTNGYLLDREKIDILRSFGTTLYQITLDGDEITHNKTRHLNGGGDTFERIWESLLLLRDIPYPEIRVRLRVNVDENTFEGAQRLITDVAREFGSDPRFNMAFHSIFDYNETAKADILLLESPIKAEKALRDTLRDSTGTTNCIEYDVFGAAKANCYAAWENSLVIGSDGTLYKCTVAFDDERNIVGKLLPDGTPQINSERMSLWTQQDYRTDSGCSKCFYSPACLGSSCPLQRMASGEAPCPPAKTDIKSTLETYYGNYLVLRDDRAAVV